MIARERRYVEIVLLKCCIVPGLIRCQLSHIMSGAIKPVSPTVSVYQPCLFHAKQATRSTQSSSLLGGAVGDDGVEVDTISRTVVVGSGSGAEGTKISNRRSAPT